jgi:hypothetical protein
MSQKINVDIITEYKGRQNLKNAENDMGVLGQAAKKLGGIFAATFAAEKIIAFGKASVEAFAANEKSAKILTNTLNNLGIGFDNVPVESFITKLSELNGIAKTDLRTSFDTLVRSTGDATKAQDLLSLGLDVSAGTGKDLALVTTALAKAYGGNFAAISKLGAGITAAELKSKDFTAIQKHLASVFAGDASIAADTFQGKINRLKTSFEEFKITIGSGIVDALTTATGSGSGVDQLQSAMTSISTNIADSVRGLGVMINLLSQAGAATQKTTGIKFGQIFKDIGSFLGFAFGTTELTTLGKNDKTKKVLTAGLATRPVPGSADAQAQLAAVKLLATQKAQAATQKAITDQKAKQLKLDQQALGLKLAGNTTDMQNIEIQAALQRGQTEQVTNVLLLQRAIITGNADQANILAQEVLKANGLVMDVNGNITTLANAKDPFKDWPPATAAAMAQLKAIQDALAAIKDKTITVTVNTVNTGVMAANQKAIADIASQAPTAQYPHGFTPEGVPIVTASQAAADAAQSAQDQADMLAAAQASQALAEAAAQAAIDSATAASDAAYAKALAAIAALDAQYAALTGSPSSSLSVSQIAAMGGAGSSTYMNYLNGLNNNGLYANPSSNGSSTIGDYQKANPIVVNVQIDGTAITNTLVNNSASGIPTTMNRSGYFAGLTS